MAPLGSSWSPRSVPTRRPDATRTGLTSFAPSAITVVNRRTNPDGRGQSAMHRPLARWLHSGKPSRADGLWIRRRHSPDPDARPGRPGRAKDHFASNAAVAAAPILPRLWVGDRYGPAGSKRQILSTVVQSFRSSAGIALRPAADGFPSVGRRQPGARAAWASGWPSAHQGPNRTPDPSRRPARTVNRG
jgi:hypothetical protein